MISVHARYRGRDKRRAELVSRSAEALATLGGIDTFEVVGVEDIRTNVSHAEAACMLIMALLSDGGWAIGLGINPTGPALFAATDAVGNRAGVVGVIVDKQDATETNAADDIAAAFSLISHVLAKRTLEGREATSLVRSGLNQNQAAEQLGISKQAMSQRLQAAGWHAEQAGWQLAVNLINRAAQG